MNESAERETQSALKRFGDEGILEWRSIIARADRAGDPDARQAILDEFVQRLKADFERRFPRK